jgi:peptidoglycan/LPS O-acetylase OafA/YrhL
MPHSPALDDPAHESANLDLLRSIAVGLVVGSHLAIALHGTETPVMRLAGQSGVAIFFVHTCLVLLRSFDRHGPAAIPFYVRRFFRLYPLAVFVVLLVAIGRALGGLHVDPLQLASNLLLVQNITGYRSDPFPLWSLSYEVQMYAVLPLLYLLARTRLGPARVGALWFGTAALVIALKAGGVEARIVEWVPCFLSGVLAYSLTRRAHARNLPAWWLFVSLAMALAAAAVLQAAGVPLIAIYWCVSLAVGLAIPLCRDFTVGWLARAAKVIAKYSYGIYLTHVFAIDFPFDMLRDWPVWVRLAVFALVLTAWARVAYRWIEEPGIELGKRIAGAINEESPLTRRPGGERHRGTPGEGDNWGFQAKPDGAGSALFTVRSHSHPAGAHRSGDLSAGSAHGSPNRRTP